MNEFNYNVNSFWTGHSYRYKGESAPTPDKSYEEGGDIKGRLGNWKLGMLLPEGFNDPKKPWMKESMYPLITNAIKGEGFGTDEFNARQRSRARTGLQESFDTTKSEMGSQLARTLRPGDNRVRNFVGSSLDRAYTTSKDTMERGFRESNVADRSMGMDMAGTMLANEQRISIGNSQAFNNALTADMQRANTMGTFATNISSGIGQGGMDYMFAQQMGAR
jgi:hypothetical protein